MKGKTVYFWRSTQKALETLTQMQKPTDIYQKFIKNHAGENVVLLLRDHLPVEVILLGGNEKILAIRKHPFFIWLLVNRSQIVGIAKP